MTLCPRSTGWFIGPLLVMSLAVPGCIGVVGIGDKESKPAFLMSTEVDATKYERTAGKPTRIEVESAGSGREVWIYQQEGLRWRGIVLFAIVPIPLIVPVGHNEIILVVEQGRILSSANRESNATWGAFCGFIWHPHSRDDTGFHCASY